MILKALTDYYEALEKKGAAFPKGWGSVKVSFGLDLSAEGAVKRVVPLASPTLDGKKTQPQEKKLPAAIKRASNVSSNFLWDNSSYLLGTDSKGNPSRTKQCFEAAKELHMSLLSDCGGAFAKAICHFFECRQPGEAEHDPLFADSIDDIRKGANLVFMFDGRFPGDDDELCRAWQRYYDRDDDGKEKMRCLVTGELSVPENIHPAIKNVAGAQSSGAALVSFNSPSLCSFDRTQDLNAPVSKYAAFAYTTALNLLLADRKHVHRYQDTTIVYWSEDADSDYQDAFDSFIDGGGDKITDSELGSIVAALAQGKPVVWDKNVLHPDNRFYILALAPNASRLSVRFFLRSSFGDFAKNVGRHYRDTEIVSDGRGKGLIPMWLLLRGAANEKSRNHDVPPQAAGDMLRAILSGGRYPATVYEQVQLRIRAEHVLSRERAAIIKGYLTRLTNNDKYREALTVELNEETNYQPYLLGRIFSVLEALQQTANPGINTTIMDKYFTSACATPAIVFPTLISLAQKHLRKLDGGIHVYYSKQLTELLAA
jgi:CRISPR-associated protein Csd1